MSKNKNYGVDLQSKSQRKAAPVINPITLHQPEFHRSGIVEDKYPPIEVEKAKTTIVEAERILQ